MPSSRSLLRTLALAIWLVAVAAPALAGQINLRWNACWGDGGIMNKVFACDTNTGSNTLVGSFIPPQDLHQVTGMRCVVDLAVAGGSLPGWWQFHNSGSCRQSLLLYSTAEPLTAVNCVDWDSGQAVGSLVSYTVDPFGPGSARIVGASAAGADFPADLTAGQEYFAFSLIINNQKTVGTGACAGCGLGACVALKGISLTVPPPANTFNLFVAGNDGSDDRLTTWQGGAGVLERKSLLYLNCPLATPARSSTWGAVKALYR